MGSWNGLLGTQLAAGREKKMREIEKMERVLKDQRKNEDGQAWKGKELQGGNRNEQRLEALQEMLLIKEQKEGLHGGISSFSNCSHP